MGKLKLNKEQFMEVYEKYPPNGFIKFIYKYFSKGTVNEDKMPSKLFSIMLIILFVTGFIGTIVGASQTLIAIATFSLAGLLGIFGIISFIAFTMNRKRIKKVMDEMGVSIDDYNAMADLYT